MAAAGVYVEVDLEEFSDEDLLREVKERLKNGGIRNGINGISFENVIFAKSLDDQLKIEYLQEVWDRLTPMQLETGLNAIIKLLGK